MGTPEIEGENVKEDRYLIKQKEKERIYENLRKQLMSGTLSILKWTRKRSLFAGREIIPETDILDFTIKLEEIGLLDVEKIRRVVLLQKALSVLNWAEARAKPRKFSTKELLTYSLKVLRSLR